MKFLRKQIENLDVTVIITAPASGDGDLLAVVEGCRGEGMDSRGGDSDDAGRCCFKIIIEIDSENAPPTIIGLTVEENSGVAGPSGPTAVFADNGAFTRVGCFEEDNIRLEIVEVASPRAGPVRCDGDEFARARDSRAVINVPRRREADDFAPVVLESGGV